MMIYLVEHFYSIQGEGKYTGVPSLFFRFGLCNMKCEGFNCKEIAPDGSEVIGCDTLYAVNKEHFGSSWQKIESLSQLQEIINSYELPRGVDVVLTGGEPLIYADHELFVSFLEYLHQNNHRVTFETNASMKIDFEKFPIYKEFIYALSIKLSNSGEKREKRVVGEIFSNIAKNSKECFFKFTLDEKSLLSSIENEIDEIIKIMPNVRVYCMPLGGSAKEVEKNAATVIEFCKKRGFYYSDRLHIRIWDQNKGV